MGRSTARLKRVTCLRDFTCAPDLEPCPFCGSALRVCILQRVLYALALEVRAMQLSCEVRATMT